METGHKTFFCSGKTPVWDFSGGWQGWEPQLLPTPSLLLGKAAFTFAKGRGPTAKVPWQSGFTVKCLQPELGRSCPGTLRTRSYPHLLFSSETQPRAGERTGLVSQTELGSTSGLGICNPHEYSEPQSVHLCNGVIATCRG